MADIKIRRRGAQIGPSGLRPVQRSAGEDIAGALQQFGKEAAGALVRKKDRDETTKITALENDVREQSMTQFIDASTNRLEKSAEGAANEYAEGISSFISERMLEIDRGYQGAAAERLNSVVQGYSGKFSLHESQQMSTYRTNVNKKNVELTKVETVQNVRVGNINHLLEGLGRIEEFTMAAAGTQVEAGELQVQTEKTATTKNAIMEKAAVDPRGARELLNDERIQDFIDDRDLLEQFIDKKEVEIDAKSMTAALINSDLSYQDQVQTAQDRIENPDTLDVVLADIDKNRARQKRVQAETQFDVQTDMYDKIFVQQDPSIDVNYVRNSDDLDSLTFSQRMTVESWLGNAKAGQMDDANRTQAWIDATNKIISGEWDAADVKANFGTAFDIRDTKTLVNYAEQEATNPESLRQVDAAIQALYPKVYRRPERKSQVQRGVMLDIENFKEIFKKSPNRQEVETMLKDRAEGFVVPNLIWPDTEEVNRLQATYENIDEPGYKFISGDDMKKYPDYATRTTIGLQQQGFRDANYIKSQDLLIIGEPPGNIGPYRAGTFYIMQNGVMYELPADSPLTDQYKGNR